MLLSLLTAGLIGCASDPLEDAVPADLRFAGTEMATLAGTITWTVSVDAEAEAAGFVDCTYRRDYAGTEDRSRPWLCPDCDVQVVATVEMPEEDVDCWLQVSTEEALTQEWIGVGADAWWRSSTNNAPLNVQSSAADDGSSWQVSGRGGPWALEAGTYSLDWQGSFEEGATLGDPLRGLRPPPVSDCGWPRVDTPTYDGPQTLAVGEQIPDGLFWDLCEQGVSLHDFAGRYLVIEISTADCLPCQVQAATEHQWLQSMRAEGHHVEVVTLLAASLNTPFVEPPTQLLIDWTLIWGLRSPVLADRGWGYTLSAALYPDAMAYPTSLVVAPNTTLLGSMQGFEGWQPVQSLIFEDAGAQ